MLTPLLGADPSNQPPRVQFLNESFEQQDAWTLQITAHCEDDGFPSHDHKSFEWEIIVGTETNVKIEHLDEHTGLFRFSSEGEYGIRFIANDGDLATSADCFVTVCSDGISGYRTLSAGKDSVTQAANAWNKLKAAHFKGDFLRSPEALGFDREAFHLKQDSEVIVTLLHDGARLRNSLAWHDENDSTSGHLIWQDVASGWNAPLLPGARASLGLLPAGTDLRFYLVQNGAQGGSQTISQDPSRNPKGEVLCAARFPESQPNRLFLAFEDRSFGDYSYNDVIIQVEIIETGRSASQFDGVLPGVEGLYGDRGRRGVKALLERESLNEVATERTEGVFQMPFEETEYEFTFLDDRSSMKFSLLAVPVDRISDFSANSLLFRKQAAIHGVVVMDDRQSNPGDTVRFAPHEHGLSGTRVVFAIIPNNTPSVFLRNPWRYTARGHGNRTKRQPLFSNQEANPDGEDQFLFFQNEEKTVIAIEDHTRADAHGESGADSDHSFDDIQLRVTPALVPTTRYGGYYGKTIDYTVGHEASDGLSSFHLSTSTDQGEDAARLEALLSNWDLPTDDVFLISQFGSSLHSTSSGAVSVNIQWEYGIYPSYYVGQQRYGADVIETGVLLNDDNLIARGIAMINWGMERQESNGSFSTSADHIHSSLLFLEGASRAGLILTSHDSERYQAILEVWKRKVHLGAHHFVQISDVNLAENLVPFQHRYFLRAATLCQASAFTRDPSLEEQAEYWLKEGLAVQSENGALLERGLFDASYHMVGMAMATRYHAAARNSEIAETLEPAIRRGIERFMADVTAEGEVLLVEGCRTQVEVSRSGDPKRFDYKHTTQALVYAEQVLAIEDSEAMAESLLTYQEERVSSLSN